MMRSLITKAEVKSVNFPPSLHLNVFIIYRWKVGWWGGEGGSSSALRSIRQPDDAGRRLLTSAPANQAARERCALRPGLEVLDSLIPG